MKPYTDNLKIKYLYLYSKFVFVSKFDNTSGPVPAFNRTKFNSFKIPLPSLEVQQQIVDELSQIELSIKSVDNRISELKREKEQYKKYGRKAEIRDLIKETDKKMIGDICEIIKGEKINSKLGKKEGIYPLFYCSILGSLRYDSFTYDGEGLIINSTNGSGKCAIYYVNGKYNVGNSTFHFKSRIDELINKYLYLFLKMNINLLESEFKGIDKKSITKERLFNLKIPVPSQEIQKQCIQIFEEKEEVINQLQDRIESEKNHMETLNNLAQDIITSFCSTN